MSMSSIDYLLTFAIRTTSLAIAGYDYLETLPSALKFYHHQWNERRRRIGASTFLFFLIRISSILVLTISNYGFFGKFTQTGCDHYYLLSPAFKVIQGMVSHGILGLRAYTVSSKNKWIGWSLLTMFVIVVIFEWITTMGGRIAQIEDNMVAFLGEKTGSKATIGSCRPQSVNTDTLYSAWIYYALAIVFDVATTAITMYYLVKQLKLTSNSRLSQVVRSMLRDGIGYLVALTFINAVNLYFYLKSKALQNAFASLGYTVTWIMSQRLILHLHRASIRKRNDQIMTSTGNGLLTITQQLTTNRSVNHALRTQLSKKHETAFTDLTVPEFSMDLERPSTSTTIPKVDVDPEEQEDVVEVRVEKTVKVSSNSKKVRYELENYSRGAIPGRQDSVHRS